MDVRFRLWDSTGAVNVYTFPIVFEANYPHTEKNIIEHVNPRGKGSLVMDTGDAPWDLTLKGVLYSTDYQNLTTLIDALEAAVALNTPYQLKINKTSSTYYTYHVKRLTAIEYGLTDNRVSFIEYSINLRVNCW